jgi:thymidylate kinase
MLVCFEGCDGSGKDTIADAVAKELGGDRLNFPNRETETGRMIDAYLKRQWSVRPHPEQDGHGTDPMMSALAFQALQVANRMEVMPRLIEARDTERHIVLARYWESGWVYGQLDGLDAGWLERIHATMAQPQVHVLLDVSAEVCMARRASRDAKTYVLPNGSTVQGGPELYEGKLEKVRRIIELYRALWRREAPFTRHGRWVVVDATRDVGLVIADAMRCLEVQGGP